MSQPKVSVIIPVYNTEKYLRRCLDSVTGQTLRDIEIICVDDGSTDLSKKIINDYSQVDNRIITVDLFENHGVSFARNIGISIAKGKYISFVDSDDTIHFDFISILYELAEEKECDIARGELQWVNEDGTIRNYFFEENKNNFTNLFTSALYRTDYIKIHNINFPIRISNNEDSAFLIKAISTTEKYAYNRSAKYIYNRRYGSLFLEKRTPKSIRDVLDSFLDIAIYMNNYYSEIDRKTYIKIYKELLCISRNMKFQSTSIKEVSLECAKTTCLLYSICKDKEILISKLQKEDEKFAIFVKSGNYIDLEQNITESKANKIASILRTKILCH